MLKSVYLFARSSFMPPKRILQTLFFILLLFTLPLISFQPAIAGVITLQWDANTEGDLAGYIIYYGTASGLYDKSVDVKNVTTYTLTDLDLCTRYYVAVKAYDYSGNISDSSNEVNGFPKGAPPAAIAVSPAGTVTTTTPIYTWNAVCSSRGTTCGSMILQGIRSRSGTLLMPAAVPLAQAPAL